MAKLFDIDFREMSVSLCDRAHQNQMNGKTVVLPIVKNVFVCVLMWALILLKFNIIKERKSKRAYVVFFSFIQEKRKIHTQNMSHEERKEDINSEILLNIKPISMNKISV